MSDVAKYASNGDGPGRLVHFWCPGCDDAHQVSIEHRRPAALAVLVSRRQRALVALWALAAALAAPWLIEAAVVRLGRSIRLNPGRLHP